jgi:Carboxypeptidase regulatory-like domain/TonB dependent receptor
MKQTVAALLVALAAVPVRAQIGGSGSIQGRVSDPSGAVVPGATVVAANVATGVKTTRRTTGAGVYVLSPLAPGEYTVTVSAGGFQTLVQEHVTVDALAVVGLNLTLPVGTTKEEVTVEATPPPLSTADARLGQTIRNEVYTALPLVMPNGGPRDPTAFMFLQAGVQSIGRWGNVMGGQDFSTEVYIEGVPITNATVQGEGRNLSFGIAVDAVEQFQVETSGTAVMYQGQGASNFVIKSGTNDFRASVYEFFRTSALDAPGFFAQRGADGKKLRPDQTQNEFGFTVSGPIQKNRLFFFASYDGYRDHRETQPSFVSIPPAAWRSGDFSALPVTIYDPLTTDCSSGICTRQPFPGNIIPADRISPISRYFQSFLPDPTNGNLQNNYLGSVPTGFHNDNATIKIDASFSARHQLSALFAHGSRRQATPYRGGTNAATFLPLPYTETRLVKEIPTTAQVKHTYVIGSRMVNQLSVGFSRLSVPIENATIDGQYPQKAGLRGLPAGEADSSFPEIAFLGPNPPSNWRGTDARAFTEALENYTLQDNLQWALGKHGLTFGFQVQRMYSHQRERTYGSLATFGFSNSQTAGFGPTGTLLTNTGNAYASYLLGELNTATVIEDSVVATTGLFPTYAVWMQDDYKLSSRLALNLGLRYDLLMPYTEKDDRWSFMNATLPNPAAGGRPGALQFAGFGDGSCHCETPIKTYYGNIQPRIGAAWSLTPKLVVRGAYGIMHTRRGAVGGRGGARNGTGLLGYSANPTFPSPNVFGAAFDWDNGVPSYPKPPFFDPSLNAGFTTARPTGSSITYGDPDLGGHPPRYQNWNLGFQYALTSRLVVGLTYAGGNGHFLGGATRGYWSNQMDPKYLALGNLLLARATPENVAAARAMFPEVRPPFADFSGTIGQMLRPFPQYSGVTDVYGDVGNSNYNSLQATLELRRTKGLILNLNYTFSKAIDDTAGTRSGYDWATERAVSTNDQTHVLNAIFLYQPPLGRGHSLAGGSPLLRALLSDWEISGITTFRSGRPIGPILAACNLPNAGSCYADYNPSFTGPARINGPWGSGDVLGANPPSFIDRSAFASPAAFTYGTTSRTLAYGLRNPGTFNQDLSLRRTFRAGNVRLRAGIDAFNVFNTVVFGGIGTNITSANFGRVSNQANSPRRLQLTGRIEF